MKYNSPKEVYVEDLFTYLYNEYDKTIATKDDIGGRFHSDGVIKVYSDLKLHDLDHWILQECKLSTHKGDWYKISAQFLQAIVYISYSLYDISIDLPGYKCKGIILNSKYFFGYISLNDIDFSSWEPLWNKYRSIVRPCDAYKQPELIKWAKKHLKFTHYLDVEDFKNIDDDAPNGLKTKIKEIIDEAA